MPTKALTNTTLKVSDGGADMHHVIQIFQSELVATCRHLLKLSIDIERKILKLSRENKKRICRSGGGGSGCKWWNNRRGWNRSTLSYVHPLKKCAIDINRGCYSSFTQEIKFQKFKETGDEHLKRKIPIWDQQVFRKHEINDEFGYIDSNTFQKVIDQKRSGSLGVAILS